MPARTCPECEGTQLSLTLDTEVTATGIMDGRHRSHDVRPVVVVGCDECSATVEIVRDAARLVLIPE